MSPITYIYICVSTSLPLLLVLSNHQKQESYSKTAWAIIYDKKLKKNTISAKVTMFV